MFNWKHFVGNKIWHLNLDGGGRWMMDSRVIRLVSVSVSVHWTNKSANGVNERMQGGTFTEAFRVALSRSDCGGGCGNLFEQLMCPLVGHRYSRLVRFALEPCDESGRVVDDVDGGRWVSCGGWMWWFRWRCGCVGEPSCGDERYCDVMR